MAGWIAERQAHARQVVGRDDRIWTVRRVLMPRPPRWIKKPQERDGEDTREGAGPGVSMAVDALSALDTPSVWAVVIVLVVALVLVSWAFIFPVLFFLADLLILLLIAAVGILLRVFLRRPWKIEAKTPGPPPEEITWGVVGMRASESSPRRGESRG
jgi:hypothetical protein